VGLCDDAGFAQVLRRIGSKIPMLLAASRLRRLSCSTEILHIVVLAHQFAYVVCDLK